MVEIKESNKCVSNVCRTDLKIMPHLKWWCVFLSSILHKVHLSKKGQNNKGLKTNTVCYIQQMSCPARIFWFWGKQSRYHIILVAVNQKKTYKQTKKTFAISSLCVFHIFPLTPIHCSDATSLTLLFSHVTHCLSPPLSFSLSLSCSPLSSLVSFEVLNNERAALPVKLIGKFRLKLHGTVQHCRIFSSGPHGDGRGEGSIKSLVSMQGQWP